MAARAHRELVEIRKTVGRAGREQGRDGAAGAEDDDRDRRPARVGAQHPAEAPDVDLADVPGQHEQRGPGAGELLPERVH